MKLDAHCPDCHDKHPAYCAPARCYCGHPACPAADSYIPTRTDNEGT